MKKYVVSNKARHLLGPNRRGVVISSVSGIDARTQTENENTHSILKYGKWQNSAHFSISRDTDLISRWRLDASRIASNLRLFDLPLILTVLPYLHSHFPRQLSN